MARCFTYSLLLMASGTAIATAETTVRFAVKQLTIDANEGVTTADVDGDGRPDIVAGRNWYQNPSWVSRPLRSIADWNGYVESNGDHIFDINADGRPDVVAGSFLPSQVHWYENPGPQGLDRGQQWTQHLLLDTGITRNEGVLLSDLDKDGIPEWVTNSWAKNVPLVVCRLIRNEDGAQARPGKQTQAKFQLRPHQLGAQGNGHGCGTGDINNDGRDDVLVGQGWYEQPAQAPWSQPWKFHADWDLHASLPMLVVDVNQDGKQDIIFGKAHDYGLVWWESLGTDADGALAWKEHLIDRRFSQPHALAWADLTGDGEPELITGKRYFAHNGNDPGGKSPPCLYYYTCDRGEFTRHTIDEGHVGTGLQIAVADFNRDGRKDLAVAGKTGTFVLINEGGS